MIPWCLAAKSENEIVLNIVYIKLCLANFALANLFASFANILLNFSRQNGLRMKLYNYTKVGAVRRKFFITVIYWENDIINVIDVIDIKFS